MYLEFHSYTLFCCPPYLVPLTPVTPSFDITSNSKSHFSKPIFATLPASVVSRISKIRSIILCGSESSETPRRVSSKSGPAIHLPFALRPKNHKLSPALSQIPPSPHSSPGPNSGITIAL